MKTHRLLLLTAVCLVTSGTPTWALAHGEQAHGKKPVAVRKEQKDWGIAGTARTGLRTVVFTMSDDMRFTPNLLQVKRGETLRLRIVNKGAVMHEFVLGTKKELEEHAALMLRFPNMEHDEPYMAHVAPGKTSEIIWTFNRVGDFDFACLIAGHFQAGMVGKVKVIAGG